MTLLPRDAYLTFHGIGEPPVGAAASEIPYWLSARQLSGILDALVAVEARCAVRFHITCDDGLASDYEVMTPALLSRGRVGMFFSIGQRIGSPGYVTAAQIRAMHAAGMEFGGHSDSHVDLRSLDDAALAVDLATSRARLEDIIGRAVTSLSIPFGVYDRRVIAAAWEAGYERVFTSSGGLATSPLGLIPRNSVKRTFDARRDLPGLVSLASRVRSAVVTRARRLKHGVAPVRFTSSVVARAA